MRVVDPNRSRCASAAVTATSWASSSRGSPVSAHHTDNDFGAENVASNPDTARTTRPSRRVPVHQLPAQRCPRRRVTARQQRLQRSTLDPTRQARARPPGGPTTHPAPHPAPPSGTRRSTPPSPPPTTRAGSSPAASAHPTPPPTAGHLSETPTARPTGDLEGGHETQPRGSSASCSTASRDLTARRARAGAG